MYHKPKQLPRRMVGLTFFVLLVIYLGSFTLIRLQKSPVHPPSLSGKDTIRYCAIPGTNDVVPFTPLVPPDVGKYVPSFTSQVDANSFAWWEFISLNWCDAEKGFFGKPYDTLYPVQWETFITKDELFPPGGKTPPAWGSAARSQKIKLAGKETIITSKLLSSASKFTAEFSSRFDSTILDSNNAGEAAPESGPNWLGAQNSTNVWYEIRLNRDMYNFVVKNKLYNASNQMSYTTNQRMSLPFGVYGTDTVGALELKAAWMEVNDISNPKWGRYKLSRAVVQDLNTGKFRPVILALVGLHILHKTRSQQSWIWATFEQVDNVPGTTPCDTCTYNFNNPKCRGCAANNPPSYYLVPGGKGPTPIQVKRQNDIPSQSQQVNSALQQFIAQNYPGSVWQYYQLVDVIWSNQGTVPQNSKFTPLNYLTLGEKGGAVVANTTLETYAQRMNCYNCHAYATIAGSDSIASDFSFSLGAATNAALLQQKLARMAKLKKR